MKKCLVCRGFNFLFPSLLLSLMPSLSVSAVEEPLASQNSVAQIGQQKRITGVVTDQSGIPILGANILVKGTTNGTITDMEGRFSLSLNEGDVLQVLYIGYNTKMVTVGNQTTLQIQLSEDSKALEEVVVVGYGTQRKSDITSAVSVVDMKNIGDVPSTDPTRLLMGQAAGVTVKQSSGAPGQEMDITIRGTGSLGADSKPLYVVDGFPVGTTLNQSISSDDIESISVLKDAASTSIYGARGANGVVLITTKGAKDGELKLTATASLGIQQVPNNRKVQMMNGQEFAQFKKESYIDKVKYFEGREPSIEEIPIDFRYPEQTKTSTNWYDEVLNDNALMQNYNVTLSSGKGQVKSVVSLGYLNREGLLLKPILKDFMLGLICWVILINILKWDGIFQDLDQLKILPILTVGMGC